MSRVFDALRQSEDQPLDSSLVIRAVPTKCEGTIDFASVESTQARLPPESRLIVHTEPHSLGADRFRLLRVRLRELQGASKIKTILVTSALPREGKSTTALNLATELADHGKHKVVVVEADFRHPCLAERLGLQPWPALVKCLQEDRDPVSALRCVSPLGFYLLPAGEPAGNPIELLNGERFSRTLSSLKSCADWVIVDAPPVEPVPDAVALKNRTDGCLWVLRAGSTPREVVDEAIRQIGKSFLLGMLLNGLGGLEASYSTYYRYRRA